MQITYDQAAQPGRLMSFARKHGRDYMMRSEKRPGMNYSGNGSSGKKSPRKRQRAGFFYILLTILLSIVLWPIGMLMLWRRKVRWLAGTKLLYSLISLFLSIFLIVFMLTVPVENEKFTMAQDTVNDFLDNTAGSIASGADVVYQKGNEAYQDMMDFSAAYLPYMRAQMAAGIEKGVEWTEQVKTDVAERLVTDKTTDNPDTTLGTSPDASDAANSQDPTTTNTPKPTPSTPADTVEIHPPEITPDAASAQALSGGLLFAGGSFAPDMTPAPSSTVETKASIAPTATNTVKATDVTATDPSAEIDETDAPPIAPTASTDPTDAPASTEDANDTQAPDTTPEVDITEAPTEEPTEKPTASPTPVIEIEVRPAGEAVVYYNKSGKCYHMQSSCRSMGSATESTLAEAVADRKIRCRTCGSPEGEILEAEYVIWVDDEKHIHTTNECADFEGAWHLMALKDAIKDGCEPCASCQADIYCEQIGIVAPTPTPVPTPTPNATPEPTATPTPEPTVVNPATALKAAGEATVYHSSNGKYYHKVAICKGMSGSNAYTLESCANGRYKRCKTCDAPLPELVGKACLWMDENSLCHTADTCTQFEGVFTLILRDDALEQALTGCTACGADEYLIPNSIIELDAATTTNS